MTVIISSLHFLFLPSSLGERYFFYCHSRASVFSFPVILGQAKRESRISRKINVILALFIFTVILGRAVFLLLSFSGERFFFSCHSWASEARIENLSQNKCHPCTFYFYRHPCESEDLGRISTSSLLRVARESQPNHKAAGILELKLKNDFLKHYCHSCA